MMTDYGDMSLDDYRDALASSDPTPGGGTAAAVALSQAAALTCMVADLTLGSERWQDGWLGAQAAKDVATPLLARGHELAGEDAAAFDAVMAAFRLPKDSDDEQVRRRAEIRDATLGAAEVPLKTAQEALSLLNTLPELSRSGNSNAVTDVGVAGLLASAACKGALFNVEINAKSLPDELATILLEELDGLRGSAKQISRELMDSVNSRIND